MKLVYIHVCIVDFISIWTQIIPSWSSRRLCNTFNSLPKEVTAELRPTFVVVIRQIFGYTKTRGCSAATKYLSHDM